jgi:hypothetical protein
MSLSSDNKAVLLDFAESPGWDLILRLEAGRKDPGQRLLTKLATILRLRIFTVYHQLLFVIITANLIGVLSYLLYLQVIQRTRTKENALSFTIFYLATNPVQLFEMFKEARGLFSL